MPGERMCPLGCPMVLWAAHLQAQVFRVSVNMGEQLFASLGGCCRVLGGCFGWKQRKCVWGGCWLWAVPRAARGRGGHP